VKAEVVRHLVVLRGDSWAGDGFIARWYSAHYRAWGEPLAPLKALVGTLAQGGLAGTRH